MIDKSLGKIEKVSFGHGGYQDACIGIHFTLSGPGWGASDSKSARDPNLIKHSEHHQWSEETRDREFAGIMRFISGLLKDAKVSSISELKGIPIEATFEGMQLKSWRILKEVL